MGVVNIKVKINEKQAVERIESLVDDSFMIEVHNEFARIIEPWVPMDEGPLSQGYEVTRDYVRYKEEYAHYMYMGELYLAENGSSWAKEGEKKHPTGRPLKYGKEKHSLATKEWDKVAMQTEIDRFAEYVKKRLIERHKYLYG